MDVASLALAVAIVSLLWQVYTWRRQRAERLLISTTHAGVPESITGTDLLSLPGFASQEEVMIPSNDDEPVDYVLAIVVRNVGQQPAFVSDIRIEGPLRNQGVGADDGGGDRRIEPGSRLTWPFRVSDVPFDLSEGFPIKVFLASGKVIQERGRLSDTMKARIASRNHHSRSS